MGDGRADISFAVTVVHELGARCPTKHRVRALRKQKRQAERNRRTASELGLGALAQILVATAPVVKSRASKSRAQTVQPSAKTVTGAHQSASGERINISQVTASEHSSGVCHETKSDWSTERSIHRYSIQSAARWRRFAFSAWSENNGALALPAEGERIRPRV